VRDRLLNVFLYFTARIKTAYPMSNPAPTKTEIALLEPFVGLTLERILAILMAWADEAGGSST
jgi:hypothetical protein